MNALTTEERIVLNNLSKVLNKDVLLGAILQSMIDSLGTSGTPVNATAATGKLTLAGVVKDGETVTIGADVYEFVADAAKSLTNPANIAVDITSYTAPAAIVLTMDTKPTAGDTVTIGAKTYIFVPTGTANHDGEIPIGADVAASKVNLVAAINGTDSINTAHPLVSASTFAGNDTTLTAFVEGSAGNSIATTETFTAETNVFAGATLASGTDCSAANGVTALVAAITANGDSVVSAVDGTGDAVDLTAVTAGIAGNQIATTETMANGSFGANKLSGGVDATVSDGIDFKIDGTNLYVCVGQNGVSDSNWKKITLSSL